MPQNVRQDASTALNRNFNGNDKIEGPSVVCVDNTNNKIMKLTTIALAAGFALFSTFALAGTNHHRSVVSNHRGTVGMVHPHSNYGNPDGPATFRGPGKNYAVPGWTDEQTQYWIDSASGPKG